MVQPNNLVVINPNERPKPNVVVGMAVTLVAGCIGLAAAGGWWFYKKSVDRVHPPISTSSPPDPRECERQKVEVDQRVNDLINEYRNDANKRKNNKTYLQAQYGYGPFSEAELKQIVDDYRDKVILAKNSYRNDDSILAGRGGVSDCNYN